MKKNDFKAAGQQLIEALDRDMKFLAQLEKEGALLGGYNPQMRAIHEKNAELLEEFLNIYGWPYPSVYGKEIYEAAWMIVIHAISKPLLLKKVLHILENALKEKESVAKEYARFVDRIELFEGRQQIYGTQFFPSPKGWIARNLYDPEHVDKRRKALGLSTLLEFKREIGTDEGGFAEAQELEQYDAYWNAFFKEIGWR